jgi:hypothetical protein
VEPQDGKGNLVGMWLVTVPYITCHPHCDCCKTVTATPQIPGHVLSFVSFLFLFRRGSTVHSIHFLIQICVAGKRRFERAKGRVPETQSPAEWSAAPNSPPTQHTPRKAITSPNNPRFRQPPPTLPDRRAQGTDSTETRHAKPGAKVANSAAEIQLPNDTFVSVFTL